MFKRYKGIFIFLIFIVVGLAIRPDDSPKTTTPESDNAKQVSTSNEVKLEKVKGAVGGGKENFLGDKAFINILTKDYKLDVVNDTWGNSKLIKEDVTNYDFIFFSDQRFLDSYKLPAGTGEAKRGKILKNSMTLNTPIVFYSWDTVTDALIKQKIVEQKNGVYYITDMPKLLKLIEDGKSWNDIGATELYGKVNIISTDPVNSSPGTTYYGLLTSIMNGGSVEESNLNKVLPRLKTFYKKSGFLNYSPADLFEGYLKTGVGAYPIIVGYESQIIEFANSTPDGWKQVKDKVRILYPTPTIWNSHCIAALTEKGNKYIDVFSNKKVQDIAWKKYGFRTGITAGGYNVKDVNVPGIPETVNSVVPPLKTDMYKAITDSLSAK